LQQQDRTCTPETRMITYAQAINEALDIALSIDKNVICYGLGVDDPKGVFGTTLGLQQKHGKHRVFDMPTSENAMTGVAIGASLNGIRPIMAHQRLDFFLLAMDQLVNNAAKWHYTFGGKRSVPITIRLILGRGWGQGPTHSQNLQAWFAHIPGLKVVMPTTAADAKGLLLSSVFDENPVVFLEHRWLHNQQGNVPVGDYRVPLGQAHQLHDGDDVTIVSMSYMTVEALHAVKLLCSQGITCDLIDLRSISPIDWDALHQSVRKTGRLLVLDTGFEICSVASEIVANIAIQCFDAMRTEPRRLAMPNCPEPTSFGLTRDFHIQALDIAKEVVNMLGKEGCIDVYALSTVQEEFYDVPGSWFKGPF